MRGGKGLLDFHRGGFCMEWHGGKNKEISSVSTRETDTLLDVGGMNDGYCCSGGVLSVPQGPMGWGEERLPRSGYTADVGRVIEVGENGLKSENCSVRLQNRPHVHRSWPHCTTFLLNDNQSITMIVLTLNRLGGQEVQLSAEQKMLPLRMKKKREGGLSCLPRG